MARRNIAGLRTIVTGATSGIGRALAVELLRQDARVVAMGRRTERLSDLEVAAAAADRLATIAGDVTHPADRAAAIDLCVQRFGGIDALVNNAGSGAIGAFAKADEARLRGIMEVNFFAPAQFIRQALPQLRSGRTPIVVNVGSVLGHRAVPGKSEYCASKFALHGLSDALRLELAGEGIDVLLVSPSTTQSEFFEVAGRVSGSVEENGMRQGMPAETVARRIVAAMHTGRREIILSAGGNLLVWLDRLCPPLGDWVVGRWLGDAGK